MPREITLTFEHHLLTKTQPSLTMVVSQKHQQDSAEVQRVRTGQQTRLSSLQQQWLERTSNFIFYSANDKLFQPHLELILIRRDKMASVPKCRKVTLQLCHNSA